MRKFVSIIAAAALTGSIAITGAVSASANDGMGGYSILNDQQVSAAQEITSEIPAATESFTEIEQIQTETVYTEAVQFQADEAETPTEAPTEAPVQAPSSADAEAKALSAVANTGDKPEDFSVTSAVYDNAGDFWTITVRRMNGNDIRIYKVAGDTVTRTDIDESAIFATTAALATTVKSATTAAQTTTTAAQSTTTAPATKAADKNSSPKTGVPFPAIPTAGLVIAAVAVAFTLKKKSN